MKEKKVGLALGSGGYRGLAHIGIIKVLVRNNIPIDIIAGSSAGSLVGAYFALYGEVESLEKLILENNKKLLPIFFDFSIKSGLIKGNKIKRFLDETFKKATFEETIIPLHITTTNLSNGEMITISKGKIVHAILGSIAMPIIFKPFSMKEKLLVDGALSDPVPVKILKENDASFIIAVNLYHKNELNHKKFTLSKVALRSVRILLFNLAKNSIKDGDVILNPDTSIIINKIKISKYFNKENVIKMIKIGEEEALKHLPEIKKGLGIK